MRSNTLLLAAVAALLAACSGDTSQAQTGRLNEDAAADARQAPQSASQMQLSFAPVVRRAAPAVVNISSRRIVRAQTDAYWRMFGANPRPRIAQSLGSGAIVRPDGIIVTNNHVVEGGQEIVVVLPDRREFPARVLLNDPRSDLAVLKIDPPAGERFPTLAIDDAQTLEVGDLVLAIGDPFGVGQTVTSGIVSAVNRSEFGAAGGQGSPSGSFIQTDAAINPGNSGGPLVDMDGQLVGLNTFILSGSGSSAGVGFAIPAALVRRVVDTAAGGARTFARPWLGARVQPVTGEVSQALGQAAPTGLVVTELYPGGSADRAGLRQGDVILSVDGVTVNDEAALNFRLATERPGRAARLTLARERRQVEIAVPLERPPERPARDQRQLPGAQPLAGVTVINLSPAVADENGLDPFVKPGPVISSLPRDSFAARAGFRPGDVVREVNGEQIDSTAELTSALDRADGAWRIVVERAGRLISGEFGA